MTDRERWIVYPLLFLALGMSWRSRLPIPSERLVTKELIIVDDDGNKLESLPRFIRSKK